IRTPGSPTHPGRRFAADTDRLERRGGWCRGRPGRSAIVRTAARRPTAKAGLAVDGRSRRVVTQWSLRERRRELSGRFFPGLEELVDDPASGAPDHVVADRVIVDAVLLLADAAGFGGVHAGVEQLGDRDHQHTLHLVGRQPQVIDATLHQPNDRGDHEAADRGEDVIELTEHHHPGWLEADLLVALTKRGLNGFHVRFLSLTTRKRDLAFVGEDGVSPSGKEQLDPVAARQQRNQHAGADQRRRRVDAAPDAALEDLAQPIDAGTGGRRQVHASNETGTWWPQWVQTQTWPRRTTCRPSSSRTERSGPLIRSQWGMRLHWSQVGGGGLAFTAPIIPAGLQIKPS